MREQLRRGFFFQSAEDFFQNYLFLHQFVTVYGLTRSLCDHHTRDDMQCVTVTKQIKVAKLRGGCDA